MYESYQKKLKHAILSRVGSIGLIFYSGNFILAAIKMLRLYLRFLCDQLKLGKEEMESTITEFRSYY